MTVLDEILNWSKTRPNWQRDALRRLVEKGELSEDDIAELTEICKAAHGLTEGKDGIPLDPKHLPNRSGGQGAVSLESIFHHEGVNALAKDQTLTFGPHLTVVYGDNGAGKTGYTRILKTACRARGTEKILGNVVTGTTSSSPVVTIKYRVQGEKDSRKWTAEEDDSLIARVSVFDTQSASVYLKEKTDVAFRPFGLDLFDKLVQTAKSVLVQLQNEEENFTESAISDLVKLVPEGTAVSNFLNGLSALANTEDVQALSRLTDEEVDRLELLEKSLRDFQTDDPAKLFQQLKQQSVRIRDLFKHVEHVESVLSDKSVSASFDARSEWLRKKEEADRLRAEAFPPQLLSGTGSDAWKGLWQAASLFSQNGAYPDQSFPVVDEGAKCVLCQQSLDHDAGHRFRKFAAFIASSMERELRNARQVYDQRRKVVADLVVFPEVIKNIISDIRLENESLASRIEMALAVSGEYRQQVIIALESNTSALQCKSKIISVLPEIQTLLTTINERIRMLGDNEDPDRRNKFHGEVKELRAKTILAKHENSVFKEIDRKRRIAAYQKAKKDVDTRSITKKSSEVTRSFVTQKLKDAFQDELNNLAFHHIEIELQDVGGADGILYHKVVLKHGKSLELPKVISEGEQRCLSIASFFAELSTADDQSGIVFDDPVSSLDYRWREDIARRLVEAAKTRQVIVFTHDVVFLLWLKQFAEEQQVNQHDQHIRRLSSGAGVCSDELPWVAMPVKKKIGYLNKEYQTAAKLHRDGCQDMYEKEAKNIYGLLREAWERAVEEVLLCKIVERYRPGIQTQQIARLADVTLDDCRKVEIAMTKCSRWLRGHDQAAAARSPVPEPDELKADISALETWVKEVIKRRT